MRSAVNVLGIIGGMFGAIFTAVAVFIGGAGAGFGAEGGGGLLTGLGFVALLLALAGIVGGILSNTNRTASIILLLVPGVLGFVCIGAWWTLPGILLIIGGILEIASDSQRAPATAGPVTAPAPPYALPYAPAKASAAPVPPDETIPLEVLLTADVPTPPEMAPTPDETARPGQAAT